MSGHTPLVATRFVVLDTELTSLDEKTNRVLSVGALVMQGASIRLGEQFYDVLNPTVPVPAEGVVIHHLTPADLAQGAVPAEVWPRLRQFIGDAALVGHFTSLDVQALRKEMRLAGQAGLTNPALDTARIHRWLDLRRKTYLTGWDHQVTSLDLETMARLYDIEAGSLHHALDDAFLTARLWQKLIHALQAAGVNTLAAALRIGRG